MTNLLDSNTYILLIVYSIGCIFALISVVIVCVCGCRKGTPKNDLLGLDGMVKITNPDENVNHLPAPGNYISQTIGDSVSEIDDQAKRNAGGSNPHRSLPDIPIYTDGEVRIGNDVVNGDTSSELYATVDDKTLSSIAYSKRLAIANGVEPGPSLSHQSSISQSDSNYARLKENPYDKVKKTENPYANVQSSDSKENDESSRDNSRRTSWNDTTLHSTDQTDNSSPVDSAVVVPTDRRSSGPGTITVPTTNSPVSTPDIPAATAVAGRVAASQDLPYMTPPIIVQPQHFSGDSQDSSRGGYTSISVREPLANIINQTPAIRNRRNDIDPHYSTVSDDSDEMYAAIVEPNSNIYNGSETYAQIQPVTVAAEIHGHPEDDDEPEEDDDQYEPAPQPPSVDSLKHVAHVHSRQASSSSCTSSVANLGSPKPEKRQANSPLPPPPAISPDLYSRLDKDENHASVSRNLEDMYAKVHKNKKQRSDEASTSDMLLATRLFVQNTTELSTIPFQKLNEKSWSSKESFDDCKIDTISITSINSDLITPKRTVQEHCYETLNKGDKKTTKIDSDAGPASLLSNDPGYEQLNRVPSDIDPNYEVLRPHRTLSLSDTSSVGYSTIETKNQSTLTVPDPPPTTSNGFDDGYSRVNKKKSDPGYEQIKNLQPDEPNYESMSSECDNYATINQKSTESESDPNYESVKYLDVHLQEPPYERLNDDEQKDLSDLSEYEQVSSNQNSSDVPGYERIKDSGSKSSDNSSEMSNGGPDGDINGSSTTQPDQTVVTIDVTEIKITIPPEKDVTDIFHV